jgi:hypothetical protein
MVGIKRVTNGSFWNDRIGWEMRDEKKERKRRMGFGFLSKRVKEKEE